MAKTRAQQNRFIRQEALRDQLEAQQHHVHLVDIANKLREPTKEGEEPLSTLDVVRLKAAADIHKSLVDKYVPSLKSTDSTVHMTAQVSDATDDEIDARLAHYFAKAGESGGS